jgi:hypothetical protein
MHALPRIAWFSAFRLSWAVVRLDSFVYHCCIPCSSILRYRPNGANLGKPPSERKSFDDIIGKEYLIGKLIKQC